MDILKKPQILLAPISLYLLSLFFSPFHQNGGGNFENSAQILVLGWVSIGSGYFYWLANPLFWIALCFWSKPLVAATLSFASFGLAIIFVFIGNVDFGFGVVNPDILLTGYYLWLSSFVALVLISLFRVYLSKKSSI